MKYNEGMGLKLYWAPMKRETNDTIKYMIRKCIRRRGNSQADKRMKNCLSYTSTGIRLWNMMAGKCATDRDNSQTKLQRKGKQPKLGLV